MKNANRIKKHVSRVLAVVMLFACVAMLSGCVYTYEKGNLTYDYWWPLPYINQIAVKSHQLTYPCDSVELNLFIGLSKSLSPINMLIGDIINPDMEPFIQNEYKDAVYTICICKKSDLQHDPDNGYYLDNIDNVYVLDEVSHIDVITNRKYLYWHDIFGNIYYSDAIEVSIPQEYINEEGSFCIVTCSTGIKKPQELPYEYPVEMCCEVFYEINGDCTVTLLK